MSNEMFSNLISRNRNTESVEMILGSNATMPMSGDNCTLCGKCRNNCPTKAISIEDGTWSVDLGKCILCFDCFMVCPNNSIREVQAPDYSLSREELIMSADTDVKSIEKRFDTKICKLFGKSLAIRELDTGSCNACEVDLNAMSNQFYDLHRFRIKVVASPRHADALVVTGPMTNNMHEAAVLTYEAVPKPKLVIASGACAISGGMFVGGDVFGEGIKDVLVPDMYIPGCPPTPDRVIRALVKALDIKVR